MGSFWAKLTGLFRRRPPIHIPTGTPFCPLDIEGIKKSLRISERGKDRGKGNLPAPDANSFDEVENQIVGLVEDEGRRSYQDYADYLKAYKDRLLTLDIESRGAEIDACALDALGSFHAEVREGQDYLWDKRQKFAAGEIEFRNFQEENNLTRTPHLPESTIYYWGIILAFIVIESALNGTLLARGAELGFLEGVFTALGISFCNVGLGFAVGKFLLPNLFHRKVYRKIIGFIGTPLYVVVAFTMNLLVAHYRDALGGEFPEQAARLGISTFLSSPLGIVDFKSWLLVLLGFSFSVGAAGDALKMDDPYPGYGRVERKRNRYREDYSEEKAERVHELGVIKGIAMDRMREAYEDVKRMRSDFYSILESRDNIKNHFAAHLRHLQSSVNMLLSAYRETNRAARSTEAPKHFSENFALGQTPTPDFAEANEITSEVVERSFKKAADSYDRRLREVAKEYEAGIRKYEQIEELAAGGIRSADKEAA